MRPFVFLVVVGTVGVAAAAPRMPRTATAPEIVVHASDISQGDLAGTWTLAQDETSAEGVKLVAGDEAAPASDVIPAANGIARPLAQPNDYFDVTFSAPGLTPYRVWVRLRGGQPASAGDGVWVQFSDALVNGRSAYRIGSTDALLVTQQSCSGCTLSGWGWRDSSWRLAQASTVTFAADGSHALRIQAAATGVEIDQIVLSPRTYLNGPPGPAVDDVTNVRKR